MDHKREKNRLILDINTIWIEPIRINLRLTDKFDTLFENENNSNQFSLSTNNTLSGKDRRLSNEIIALSHIREEIRTNMNLLKPLMFVQDFAKINKKEDDILIWAILGSFLGFVLGLFIALIKEVITK